MKEFRIKVGEGGRLVIPAIYRKQLGVVVGDSLCCSLKDGELRLFTQKQALRNIRAFLKENIKGENITDDFIAFRKKDSGE